MTNSGRRVLGGTSTSSRSGRRARDVGRRTLEAGRDFDVVVFGISLGMVRTSAPELVEHVTGLAVHGRQPRDRRHPVPPALAGRGRGRTSGGPARPGATVSGFVKPFDTWASMSHLLPVEDWPAADAAADHRLLLRRAGRARPVGRRRRPAHDERDAVRAAGPGSSWTPRRTLWPAAVDDARLPLVAAVRRWIVGDRRTRAGSTTSTGGPTSIPPTSTSSPCRAPTSTGCSRDATGFDNLVVAGDWTDSGLNAGCVEAATRSGQLAAQAVHATGDGSLGGEPDHERPADGGGHDRSRPGAPRRPDWPGRCRTSGSRPPGRWSTASPPSSTSSPPPWATGARRETRARAPAPSVPPASRPGWLPPPAVRHAARGRQLPRRAGPAERASPCSSSTPSRFDAAPGARRRWPGASRRRPGGRVECPDVASQHHLDGGRRTPALDPPLGRPRRRGAPGRRRHVRTRERSTTSTPTRAGAIVVVLEVGDDAAPRAPTTDRSWSKACPTSCSP